MTDNILWEVSPSRAYARIGFVIIFFVLGGLLLLRQRTGLLALAAWSLVQLLLLLGNIAFGLFSDFTVEEAAGFLFLEQPGSGFLPFFALVVLFLIFSAVLFFRSRKASE